ncbi:TIMELESS-interacting protein [Protobothrops mucrosquamatus]|uniref:TIMELESS-interacting protein n=1 Tax=Protobothrops mucrosquamatus TaxID=103944 RepID=UPI000775ED73|nr:TIMELESS-interacting protein [Protobothrops mucrosquamatus]XP_015674077.1 TIMELESS-interacting protein [Protobothrops mucrosquamatus]XP_015674078.1 TIMELESS-interacting protein [Protobothrops mucrosquamatus]
MIDPVENNFFGLPEYEHTRDETFQPLPPPGSPGSAEDALPNGDPEGDQLPQSKDSSVTARRAVKRTIPKLDAQRLISERGLPALCNLFDNVKFKGKGHEEADLKTLIRHMEHWAHRLFPQLQFEKVVDKIESLGNKKPVQVCLKKIRLDLPLLNEDFRSNEGEDENHRLSPAAEEFVFLPETQNTQNESGSPSLSPALTEEQQQRIEWNRQRALERRQAKNQLSQSQNDELPTNEEYGIIPAQEKDDICIDKAGVPFQATENMQVV